MTKKVSIPSVHYTPEELKILFEALNATPGYLSKRFVLINLLGWTEQALADNMKMIEEETALRKMGKQGGY